MELSQIAKTAPIATLPAQLALTPQDVLLANQDSSLLISVSMPAQMDNMVTLIAKLANHAIQLAQSALVEATHHAHLAQKDSHLKPQPAVSAALRAYTLTTANAYHAQRIVKFAQMDQLVPLAMIPLDCMKTVAWPLAPMDTIMEMDNANSVIRLANFVAMELLIIAHLAMMVT
jgi:hypothetical protein